MQVVPFPSRQARAHYRHELQSLTYVTLDDANPGVIRDLSSGGLRVRAVSVLRQKQRVRVRFNLRVPRISVEADGEVAWADSSGQCGVRFLNLPDEISQQIRDWIFTNLLEIAERRSDDDCWIFARVNLDAREGDGNNCNGLTLSSVGRAPIRLSEGISPIGDEHVPVALRTEALSESELNWLSRPLSARTVALAVDGLLILVAVLLFALIFLSITHELPAWPLTLGSVLVVALLILGAYRSLFALFGGGTLGARLMQIATGAGDGKGERVRPVR